MAPDESPEGSRADRAWFTTTHWSVILAAKADDTAVAAAALEKLCRAYWHPLYAYIKRDGYTVEDAQDLTQEFLRQFVHKEWLNHLRDHRAKFRSFLLTFLKRFLSDQRDRRLAQKRPAAKAHISLDEFALEESASPQRADGLTPEQVFEQRWAQAVLERATKNLADYYRNRGNAELYEKIKDVQPGEHGEQTYAEIGAALGITEQAVKNAVHGLRRRYAESVRAEIAQTVSGPEDIQDELRHLLTIFAR